jgi:hypothetical protein
MRCLNQFVNLSENGGNFGAKFSVLDDVITVKVKSALSVRTPMPLNVKSDGYPGFSFPEEYTLMVEARGYISTRFQYRLDEGEQELRVLLTQNG